MAETIRGLNVEIGGETAPLERALREVNQQSRRLQGELRSVDNLLRLDPSNTELVSQRQTVLAQTIARTSERLDALRQAQAEVDAQFQRGEISEQRYRSFQRDIIRTEQELRRLEGQLDDTSQESRNFGETFQRVGSKLSDVGKTLSTTLTPTILGIGGAFGKSGVDAENATNRLQAQLALTAEEAGRLGGIASDVWAKGFGESRQEISDNIRDIRMNMGALADDEMARVAEGALTIADLFDSDVREITAAAGVAMKNWGISGEETLDILTRGFQLGGDFSGELLDTIREYAPHFAEMGITAEQAMGMLVSGAQTGAWNLDKVGDAVKEFHIRAQDGSKGTQEGFEAIGLNAKEMGKKIADGGEEAQSAFIATIMGLAAMKDAVAQDAAGVAVFGTQWEDVRSQVIVAMADGVNSLTDFEGATAKATETAYENNPGRALTEAFREMQNAIGPILATVAQVITTTIVPAIKSLSDWFNGLSDTGKKTVLGIAGIVAAIGPLLFVGGKVASVVGTLANSFGAVAGVISTVTGALSAGTPVMGALTATYSGFAGVVSGLGTAFTFLTGPVGIAIAAIAAVGYGAYKLNQHMSQEAIPAVEHFGEGVSEATQQAAESFLDLNAVTSRNLTEMAIYGDKASAELKESVSNNINTMAYEVASVLESQKQEALGSLSEMLANTTTLTEEEKQAIVTKTAEAYEEKKAIARQANGEIQTILAQASAEARALTDEEQQAIKQNRELIAEQGIRVMTDSEAEQRVILERMRENASSISAQQAAETVRWSGVQRDETVKAAEDQYNKTLATIIQQRDGTKAITAEQAEAWIADAQRARDETIAAASETHQTIVAEAQAQAGEHVALVNWETGEILTRWQVLEKNLKESFAKIGPGLKEGWAKGWASFKEGWDSSWASLSQSISEIKESIKNAFGSINLKEIGKAIIDGLTAGIKSAFPGLSTAIGKVTSFVSGRAEQDLEVHSPSRVFERIGRYVAEGLAQGIEGGTAKVSKAAQEMTAALTSAVQKINKELDRSQALSKAQLDLEIALLGDTATAAEKLTIELQKLSAEHERGAVNVEVLSAAYEKAKSELGENSDATQQYLHDLQLAQIELQKLDLQVSNSGVAMAQARMDDATSHINGVVKNLERALDLSQAQLDLEIEMLEDTGSEVEKLNLEMQQLAAQQEVQAQTVALLQSAYDQAKAELGENSETTKKYAEDLQDAQIEMQKTEIAMKKMTVTIQREEKRSAEAIQDLAEDISDLRDELKEVEQQYRVDLATALEEYQQNVASVNKKLAEDEAALTAQYENELKSRTKSLSNFVGLFDQVTNKSVSGKQLLENLRGQLNTLNNWRENMTALEDRGVDSGLMAELREMGPNAAAEIAALNTLTDEQLDEYVLLWQEKNQVARQEATAQLEEMRLETQNKIQEIRQDAAKELERYRKEWEEKNNEIKKNVEETLKTIDKRFAEIAQKSTNYGISTMSNFIGGVTSQFDALRKAMQDAADIVDSYMPHSPAKKGPLSKIMEWGPALVGSLVTGIEASLPSLERAALRMAGTIGNPELTLADPTRHLVSKRANTATGVNQTKGEAGSTVINYTQVVNSPKAVDAYEADRLNRQANRRLALQIAR